MGMHAHAQHPQPTLPVVLPLHVPVAPEDVVHQHIQVAALVIDGCHQSGHLAGVLVINYSRGARPARRADQITGLLDRLRPADLGRAGRPATAPCRINLRNVKQCLRGEGNLAAAIGYYRADEPGLRHFAADGAYAAEEQALASAGPQPTLYLHGNRDGCIDLSLVQDAGRHLAAGSRMEVVEGAGHFLHVKKPAAVNDRILAWVSA